ncbi:PREDICTED: uncharacterized protein LOC109163251 [Ipomoea nil]|uniref:uncharacterized protein LOC109163251 n=1 Tax=Ipomoea nil TaxID=35883 RepID=UPI0009019473|nr:PREDICTED: uncharacterized protein LOC109163251 [Ipomoea nil]
MKKEVAEFVGKCLNGQKIKAECWKVKGLVQPLEVPQGKWDSISMDFVGANRLALPMELERVHNVFHVSQLKRYVHDPAHGLPPEVIPLDEDLTYEERPLRILDFKTRDTRRKSVKMVKVWWTHHGVEEATCELESTMREQYPKLFLAVVS